MKTTLGIVLSLGMLVALCPTSVAQTSMMEVNTTLRMQDELNNIGGAPSVGGARPPAPAPSRSLPAPNVGSAPAPAPAPRTSRVETTTSSPPVAGGPRRMVKAPENGFLPTTGAQVANLGFEHMHNMRFQEAVDSYRLAKDYDSRYEPAYQGILQAVEQINQFGADAVGAIVLTEQPVKVTLADYFGWIR